MYSFYKKVWTRSIFKFNLWVAISLLLFYKILCENFGIRDHDYSKRTLLWRQTTQPATEWIVMICCFAWSGSSVAISFQTHGCRLFDKPECRSGEKKKEKRNAIVVVDVGITRWYVLPAAKSPFCYATEGLKTNKPVVEDEEERLDRSNLPVLRHSPCWYSFRKVTCQRIVGSLSGRVLNRSSKLASVMIYKTTKACRRLAGDARPPPRIKSVRAFMRESKCY